MNILNQYLKRPSIATNSISKNCDKLENFVNLNIEKPEQLTPTEMELKIQADRVMFAINKTISTLEVMAHLPYLLENDGELIRLYFTEEKKNYIFFVLNNYSKHIITENPVLGYSGLYETVNRIKKYKNHVGPNTHDGNLSQFIDLIVDNKCIRQAIRNVEKSSPISYIIDFTKAFKQLKHIAHFKLYTTGTEEAERHKQLREAFNSGLMWIAATNDIQEQLAVQRKQLGEEISEKIATFEKYNHKIASIKDVFHEDIERCLHDSEKKMMQQSNESEANVTILSGEAEKITKLYKELLNENLNEEKKLRTKRLKAETQLVSWITKYDQDVGDKQEEYEKILKEFDEEKEAVDKIEDQLDDQEEEYNLLMKEKVEEQERLYVEMAYKLLMSRAARIIQRCWRTYRERKAKRRGKKGKKIKDGKKNKT